MLKKSKKAGKSTLKNTVEIQNISPKGIWLLVKDREFYLPFAEFPWFQKATIEQICTVEFFHGKHLHWPTLDIDVHLDSLEHLSSYPLKYS